MLKYKVGDVVRIRSKEWIEMQYKDSNGNIRDTEFSNTLVPEMFQYAGQTAIIIKSRFKYRKPDEVFYRIDIDCGEYAWKDWMFDPDYNPAGELLPAEDAIRAMLDGETLYDQDGFEYHFDHKAHCFTKIRNGVAGDQAVSFFYDLCRRPAERKRAMTRWEVIDWTNSEASRGWVVKQADDAEWFPPQYFDYLLNIEDYQRARLLPDLSGVDESTIQGFEVEE